MKWLIKKKKKFAAAHNVLPNIWYGVLDECEFFFLYDKTNKQQTKTSLLHVLWCIMHVYMTGLLFTINFSAHVVSYSLTHHCQRWCSLFLFLLISIVIDSINIILFFVLVLLFVSQINCISVNIGNTTLISENYKRSRNTPVIIKLMTIPNYYKNVNFLLI